MGLTKEEYEGAITDLEQALCELEELRTQVSVNCIFNGGLEKLKQLIKEHFDNPPLKFEELEEGMWVWDNEEKRYGRVTPRSHWEHGLLSTPGVCWGVFEDNRFYRREVHDE